MKKYIILYLSLLSNLCAYSQSEVNLGEGAMPNGGSVTACTKITLQPKFSFKADNTKTLTLKVSPSTCDPFNGQDINATAVADQNYIRTKTYLIEDASRYLDEIQYFDGLGRPIQTVQRAITPSTKDLATYQLYDAVGRDSLSLLPGVAAASNNGAFIPYSTALQNSKTTYGEQRTFNQPIYEASPLNRIIKQFGPGDAWANAPSETAYQTNDQTSNACIMYTVSGTRQAPSLTKGANYPTGELYVTQTKDERTDNTRAISYEFKDKLGQVVMTRQINDGANLDTYYVYDDYGNLCYVLPPLAAGKSDTATLNLLAYQYKFNDRNLCIWKKLPGCEPVYYVYDKADRLILTQDGEQRQNSEWLFSVPDALGRVVLSGICKNSLDYNTSPLQSTVVKADWKKVTNNYKGYEVSGITLSTPTVLTVNYYDNYEFINLNSFPNWTFISQTGYGTQHGNNKTLLTGTIIAQLNNTNKLLYTAMYYDLKGQLIQTQSTNHLGGKETEYIAYNFTGQPVKKQHMHTKGTTTQTELYAYEYDHAGRLLTTKHKLNTGSEVILAQNTYDELGRLKSTAANSQAALTTNYTYNIRSWTKSISNTLLSETLDYNLNGDIGIQTWTQNSKTRKYVFAYDNISRLKSATYTGDGKFGATYTYDTHGNIKTLTREGLTAAGTYGTIDNLTFNYDGTGNQLKYITDAGPDVTLSTSADFKDFSKVTTSEYTYNKNGAMTNDLNKGQTVSFNSLNLPQEMLINNATAKGKNYYIYTATGAKLQVIHLVDPTLQVQPVKGTSNDAAYRNRDTTDYVGNKIYENGILNKILTDNGYIEGGIYYFYIKDHLGNNRIVANASGSVIQRNSYYPFGMSFGEETDLEQGKQNFKYNGKELDKTHGLNQYDYAARYMDPATVRFTTVDPLAEKYYSISPYVYVSNNPMKYIDKDGKQIGSPPSGLFGTPESLRAASLREKTGWQGNSTWDTFTKGIKAVGAFTVSVSGKVAAFLSAEGSINAALIVSGPDKGLHGYASGSLGIEKDVNISASTSVEVVKVDNAEKFKGQDLEGASTKTSVEIPVKKVLNNAGSVSLAGTHTKAESKDAGKIDGYGASVSVGFGVKKIFGGFLDKFNIGTQNIETKGFNTNSYKK